MTILQANDTYRIQIARDIDIFSISEDLQNIVQRDMENQVYHIWLLLANKLDICKGKENSYIDNYIMEIQKAYQNKY